MTVAQLKALCKEQGLKASGKKADLKERLRENVQTTASQDEEDEFGKMTDEELRVATIARNLTPAGDRETLLKQLREDETHIRELESKIPEAVAYTSITEALEAAAKRGGITEEILAEIEEKSNMESKFFDVSVTSLGMIPGKFTAGGAPSVTADVLKGLAGDPYEDPPRYGSAYEFFGGGDAGHEACVALFSLFSIGSIDTMIANFLTSLQSLVDDQSRVHCSLNINTETGRLSSRRPNLQNQPALEKDKYKIRQAFQASPGHSLIVADYGQLELRLLASMTRCRSMIDAFDSGGDFHSRTALDMFDHVKAKVDSGEVLLEWDYSKGEPTKPMLKDEFASERRKAKTLNFSIAYGKTAHGLSADWGVSQTEAQEMLEKWYDARPEVREWQAKTKAYARTYGLTRTLMGRYRNLPEAVSRNKRFLGHAERASINTPIQGGAADVAMMAMNKIGNNEKLMRLHDEVILEGPEETAAEAFDEVIKCMESPWVPGLTKTAVPLLVDGTYKHKTWYEAK
jgi:DNA polymerase-1